MSKLIVFIAVELLDHHVDDLLVILVVVINVNVQMCQGLHLLQLANKLSETSLINGEVDLIVVQVYLSQVKKVFLLDLKAKTSQIVSTQV